MEGAYPRILPALASPDCVLDMAFDEGGGQRVLDATQHANHGAMQNMEEGDWISGPGGRGHALNLDGVNETVTAGNLQSMSMQGCWTFLLFVYKARQDVWEMWFKKGFVNYGTHNVYAPDRQVTQWRIATAWQSFHGVDQPQDQWAGVGVSHDGSQFRNFLNGQVCSTFGNLGGIDDSSIAVCELSASGREFQGRMSQATLHNRALSAPEVLRLYEQPRARYDAPLMIGHMGLAA